MLNDLLQYRNGQLHFEDVALQDVATQFQTPAYVYSKASLAKAYLAYSAALKDHPAMICYAMKANSNLAILNLFARMGAGFDIVSAGELKRVIAAGGDPGKVVFSGIGKTRDEIAFALEQGVYCFNVESINELDRLNEVAQSINKVAAISLRVNPNVDAKTHPYISTGLKGNKFGIAFDKVLHTYQKAAQLSAVKIVGIDCHIGSQITELSPYLDALDKLIDMIAMLAQSGIHIEHIDVGGGLGIQYADETPPAPHSLISHIINKLKERGYGHLKLLMEPGRSLVGNAGLLLTKVQYLKEGEEKNFIVVDAAMNDLARPAMYDAYHHMVTATETAAPPFTGDVVGPICETGDWLGRQRTLAVKEGDCIAILSAGAYGMTMSSNYNTRGRAAEVLIDGNTTHLIRERETVESLYALEHIPS